MVWLRQSWSGILATSILILYMSTSNLAQEIYDMVSRRIKLIEAITPELDEGVSRAEVKHLILRDMEKNFLKAKLLEREEWGFGLGLSIETQVLVLIFNFNLVWGLEGDGSEFYLARKRVHSIKLSEDS
ncbi:hypothetical protein HOY80DRAFT_997396 [Tuber brumale]|nr:hypothetical protein HOY80DRAFT_997396 [Tuber brumale]